MLKRILTGSLVCVLAAGLCISAMAATPVSPENLEKLLTAPDSTVIATINGANVTKGQLAEKLWLWDSARVLNDLLVEQYIRTAAKSAKVYITQKEVDKKVADTAKQMGATSAKDLMARFGLTKDRLYSGIKLNLLAEKVVRAGIKVTPTQLSQYVKASHILVKFADPKAEPDVAKREAAAKTKIDEIAAKLKGGADFAAMAKENSDDISNKMQGGDLGWFTRGRMVGEFENAAFSLKPGVVSEPVKTNFGYHLIKVMKTGPQATGTDRTKLVKELTDTKMNTDMQAFFTKATEAAKKANKLMLPPPPPPKMPEMRMPQPPPSDEEGMEPAPPTSMVGEEAPPAPATNEAPPPPPGQ